MTSVMTLGDVVRHFLSDVPSKRAFTVLPSVRQTQTAGDDREALKSDVMMLADVVGHLVLFLSVSNRACHFVVTVIQTCVASDLKLKPTRCVMVVDGGRKQASRGAHAACPMLYASSHYHFVSMDLGRGSLFLTNSCQVVHIRRSCATTTHYSTHYSHHLDCVPSLSSLYLPSLVHIESRYNKNNNPVHSHPKRHNVVVVRRVVV